MLAQPNPLQLRFSPSYRGQKAALEERLTYLDKKLDYEIQAFRKNRWFAQKFGEAAHKEKLAELRAAQRNCLLFEDVDGLWTYAGLAHTLAAELDDKLVLGFKRPEPKALPWSKAPDKKLRYYQTDALEKLLDAGHAGVSIGTGLGKSVLLMHICKRLGLKAVVMAPAVNIANQLYEEFAEAFGKKNVGAYFDGKKQHNRLLTVAVAASLTRIGEDSEAWASLSKADVFIADESHMCPAKTLAKVCFGLCAKASYRFFFSGTQIRNDGLGLLLDAITGPIVYEMSVKDGVDQGFLARPEFRMLRLNSTVACNADDPNELTRAHVYYNPQVNKAAADFANRAVSLMNRPTLILVDELEQFSHLLPHLRFEARFAHGGVNANNKENVPAAHHSSDPTKLVDEFNAGKFPILVGTSCIATGTDIRNVSAIIYLRGGKSEIEVKQSVGRGTRKPPGKEDCLFVDFAIDNVPLLKKHADARKALYAEIYPSYKEIKL